MNYQRESDNARTLSGGNSPRSPRIARVVSWSLMLLAAGCVTPDSERTFNTVDEALCPGLAVPGTHGRGTTPLPGGRLQAFIESASCYANLPRHAHQPHFRLAPVQDRPKYVRGTQEYPGKFFWIQDGEQRIGLLNLVVGEIEMFRAFPPDGGTNVEYRMPVIHGWETFQGPRIVISAQGTWTNQYEIVRLPDDGTALRLRYRENGDGQTPVENRFALRFDPVLGYLWDCEVEVRMKKPRRFEYANLLPNGVADSRDDRKRYQKSVWTRHDGAVCYQYQNPRSLIHGYGSVWAEPPADGGFLGFVTEPDMNPFVEIVWSPPLTFLTCPVWYDQHIIALAPKEQGADGLYRIMAAYRFLSLPLPLARELEDAARITPPKSKDEGPLGFRQNVVNDLETPVPDGVLYNGCIWKYGAAYDRTIGHSGTHSIRVSGGNVAQPAHGGPLLHVEHGKRYRLSAWVRTRGVTGKGVCLQVKPRVDVDTAVSSPSLTGDQEWTLLTVDFVPPEGESFAVPGLVVDGRGTAWFDDIALMELDPAHL